VAHDVIRRSVGGSALEHHSTEAQHHDANTSSMLCEITSTPIPCLATERITSSVPLVSRTPSAAVGSSSIISRRACIIPRAIATP
jgi:hypothetical protein